MPDPVCARCPKLLGQSCCEVKDHEQLATLTREDIARMAAWLGRRARDFAEEEVLTHEEAHAYERARPLLRGYFAQAPVRLTLKRRAGRCVFHQSASGCTLPAEVRPLSCRLYPFDRLPDGSWSLQVDRFGSLEEARTQSSACLAVEEAGSMEDVFAAFGTTAEVVEQVGEALSRAARAHGQSASRGRPPA